jgi:hypothetical protein
MLNEKYSLNLFRDVRNAETVCVEFDWAFETCRTVFASFPMAPVYEGIKHLGEQACRLIRQLD